jgi:prepilin-type N-terminal cleavage/methylation domain-containing protein
MKLSKYKKGFTLLEMMVAAAILVISITALLASIINSYFLNEASNNKAIAANDAQYVLEQLKNMTYDEITSCSACCAAYDFSNLPDECIEVESTENGNVKEVITDVSWTERERQRNLAITTRFAW